MTVDVKIRLREELPVDLVHGCVKGREFEAQYKNTTLSDEGVRIPVLKEGNPVEFSGDIGDLCVAFDHEYEIV